MSAILRSSPVSINTKITFQEAEAMTWLAIGNALIFQSEQSKKYHFLRESGELDLTPYDTLQECSAAMTHYAKSL